MTQPIQVAPHIYQVTHPLPFALNHVHCYLLDDGDGWTIIDAGLHTSKGEASWLNAFEALHIAPADLKRIVLTHTHPDHFGMAGWLQQWGQNGRADEQAPPILMSPREHEIAEYTWMRLDNQIAYMEEHLLHCGLESKMAKEVAHNTRYVAERTRPHPHTIQELYPGETIEMAQRQFSMLLVPGHADGQLIFHNAAEALMISGDHVLMDITPNISSWPGTEHDPLGRYLDSLEQLKQYDVALATPGHKRLITDWNGRLQELILHHDQRLQDTLAAVKEGTTVEEVSLSVFRLEQLTVHEARFAITETLAHLDYLVARHQLQRDETAVWRYYHVS
ncbi:MAG: MBL fold metallo-hydrolase [Anaerolineales bacterium]|nr:MBL fold metallo-hydrolase [Anaerolineales bacterium]